jgi:hypothetical protein
MKKSYSGLYSYGNEQSVPIPPEIDIGILIGKDSRHVKNVRARTGADCLVDLYKRCVILSGSFKCEACSALKLIHVIESLLSSSNCETNAKPFSLSFRAIWK